MVSNSDFSSITEAGATALLTSLTGDLFTTDAFSLLGNNAVSFDTGVDLRSGETAVVVLVLTDF